MAWTVPTNRSTSTLITSSIWNTDLVANLLELRQGGIAMTSQAANDVVIASSSTQLSRTATTGFTTAFKSSGQYGFFAYNSADDSGYDLTASTAIDYDTEVYDEQGNFASDTFTAPITGRYLLSAQASAFTHSVSTVPAYFILVTTARNYLLGQSITLSTGGSGGTANGSVVADMTAGDTAFTKLRSVVGTTIVSGGVVGSSIGGYWTWFCGRLLV